LQTGIWRKLLSLESRDLVQRKFKQIHGRELNARRAREITASTVQAREYFSNANRSDNSVKPLLLFYGVASLSRSIVLLLKADNGEESLLKGHGLETFEWKNTLQTDISKSLRNISSLTVRTCKGLFRDLITSTENITCLHVYSSAVDWRLSYRIPDIGNIISFGDILDRLPDLDYEYTNWVDRPPLYFRVGNLKFSEEEGLVGSICSPHQADAETLFASEGYEIKQMESSCVIKCSTELMQRNPPLFINSYLNKHFSSIPILYLIKPFHERLKYSQICISYILAFMLGMLARYYPTHWMALVRGEKGDAAWPAVNTSLSYVEQAYPELV